MFLVFWGIFGKQTKPVQLNERQQLLLRLASLIQELTDLTERNILRQSENLARSLEAGGMADSFFRSGSGTMRDPRSFYSAVRPELFVNTLR